MSSKPHEPVARWVKVLGWVILVLVNSFFGAYIALFGVLQGATTTNAWLMSFLISFIQDPLVNVPLTVCFYYVYMPSLIKHKVPPSTTVA